jgi:hypothetical protein
MIAAVVWQNSKSRGHSELNQGPAGLQPDALPLSYIPVHSSAGKQIKTNYSIATTLHLHIEKRFLSEMGFEPMPSSRTRILTGLLCIAKQGVHLESGALDHSAILTA